MTKQMEIVKNHIEIIKEYLNGVYVGKQCNSRIRNNCLDMITAMEYDLQEYYKEENQKKNI